MEEMSDRRRSERIPSRFVAELYILFPEETFRPVPFLVHVADASSDGLRVRLRTLKTHEFEALVENVKVAQFVLRNSEKTVRLYTRIKWKRLVEPAEDSRPAFELGLEYDLRQGDSPNDVGFILDRARAKEISSPDNDTVDSSM